ncbi:gerA spore germination protein [Acidiphilium sp. CAG:727]|nr:gerA spore germination protein [Acidiphilium sp. CAG:727]
MIIGKDLLKNKKILKALLCSDDVIFFEFTAGSKNALAVYVDSITDKETLGLQVIFPLKNANVSQSVKKLAKTITCANVKTVTEIKEAANEVLNGSTVILIDGKAGGFAADVKKFDVRAIAEPPTELAIRGPRNGFIESIKTNLSLVRRYLKTTALKIETTEIGKYSSTTVAIMSIDGITDPSLVKKVKEKLKSVKIDGVPDSSYLSKILNERKNSLFKQVGSTERPDVLIERMLEGRIGILVDGSPFALTLPYLLIEDFQTAEDYYISHYRANLVRALRVLAIFLSVFLPGLFVSAQLFHLQLIPLNFLLTIVNSIKGIPLSPSLEMFFLLLIFEILNETSIRMPKYVGMALAVVGALVLGETAVNAGLVSTPAVLIMAMSGISIYTVPELTETTSILRFIVLLIAGSVGGYGIVLIEAFLTCYLCATENYGVPYVAPYSPLIPNDLQDGIYMSDVTSMPFRPQALNAKNKRRQYADGK